MRKQPQFPDFTSNYEKTVVVPQQAAQAALQAEKSVTPPPPPAPVIQPENTYKLLVYNFESGNNPTKWNSTGCFGLGQNCPSIKGQTPPVLLACPTMDYNCEDAWFSNYMQTHIDSLTGVPYGTWREAWRHEQIVGWW